MQGLLDSEDTLADGYARLQRQCAIMARLADQGITPPLRRREPGFSGLANIVVSQQLSVASAASIWTRLTQAITPLDAGTLLAASDDSLRGCGLSAPKIRTLRAVASAIAEGHLDIDNLGALPADAAHQALTTVKGIGPWTADIYLLFCLGHPDAFPPGDLALQEAARLAFALDARPDAARLAQIAERWRPWRGVAAKTLWAYYKVVKSREGVPT